MHSTYKLILFHNNNVKLMSSLTLSGVPAAEAEVSKNTATDLSAAAEAATDGKNVSQRAARDSISAAERWEE